MTEQWLKFWQAMVWMAIALAVISLTTFATEIGQTVGKLNLVDVLEDHDKLAGWAQFLGAMIALGVTGWFAWGQSRQLVLREEQQLKNLALLAIFVRTGLRDVVETVAARREGDPAITATVVRDGLASTETLLRIQAPTIPSSFMMNNFYALLGHIDRLQDAYQEVVDGAPDIDHLNAILLGIEAICFNIGQEARRLGGKCRPHDDRQLTEFLDVPISTRLYWWRQEHDWKKHRSRSR